MGFDFWMGYLNQSEAHNYYPTRLWRNRKEVPLEGNVIADIDPKFKGRVAETRVTYSHDVMTDEAIDFIERQAGGPFLLHVHWIIPHANNEGGRATGDGMEVPNYGPYADRDWLTTEKGFAAMIARMDGDVGKIMDTLDRLDIAENTLIIFTSDHGPHNDGGHDHEYFDSNGPLRGYKRDLYEGGIRVPMIARWPKAIEAGAVSDYPSAFWDFLPTFCDVAGIEIPEGLDGRSIVPVFKGRQFEPNRALHWVFDMRKTTKRAVRWGKWKAVRPADNQPWELYDLERDIGEMTDLANEHPKVLDTVLATW